jgi:hypothetical protein
MYVQVLLTISTHDENLIVEKVQRRRRGINQVWRITIIHWKSRTEQRRTKLRGFKNQQKTYFWLTRFSLNRFHRYKNRVTNGRTSFIVANQINFSTLYGDRLWLILICLMQYFFEEKKKENSLKNLKINLFRFLESIFMFGLKSLKCKLWTKA